MEKLRIVFLSPVEGGLPGGCGGILVQSRVPRRGIMAGWTSGPSPEGYHWRQWMVILSPLSPVSFQHRSVSLTLTFAIQCWSFQYLIIFCLPLYQPPLDKVGDSNPQTQNGWISPDGLAVGVPSWLPHASRPHLQRCNVGFLLPSCLGLRPVGASVMQSEARRIWSTWSPQVASFPLGRICICWLHFSLAPKYRCYFQMYESPVEKERRKLHNFKGSFLFMVKTQFFMTERIKREIPIYLYSWVWIGKGILCHMLALDLFLRIFWKTSLRSFSFQIFYGKE